MTVTDTTNDDLAEAIADLANMVSDQFILVNKRFTSIDTQFTSIKVDVTDLKHDVTGLKQSVTSLWVEQQRTNERLSAVENEVQGIHSDIIEIYDRI